MKLLLMLFGIPVTYGTFEVGQVCDQKDRQQNSSPVSYLGQIYREHQMYLGAV
jgi:hypothetical protein